MPLTHCRRPDNPNKCCKSEFPRTSWLIDRAVVLCHGLLSRMGLACAGRRSKLGSLHGPINHEYLNGTSSAMLAAQCCNSDVQLPYRLPVCAATHAAECSKQCWVCLDEVSIVEAAQRSQVCHRGCRTTAHRGATARTTQGTVSSNS